ncbi:hypothetical protein GCM10010294_19990 [Streptomyces griseoloalbus]|uniref:DUF3152 domain-containing protein n=1 Tax=Streptomyces griseoloalbus TaxID=67303 RepID=UPI001873A71B|nr:hypothetical protein GCM10010294_19990 [Streptomyces griseoloalbus]
MGRHSRRGPAPKGDTAEPAGARDGRAARRDDATDDRRDDVPGPRRMPAAPPARGQAAGAAQQPGQATGGTQGYGVPYRTSPGTPAHGTPGYGTPADGVPRFPDGTPVQGVPRLPDGWLPEGTPAHGVPRMPDGTPAHGVPRLPDGTPVDGVPRLPDGTPAHGVPRARGGHPEQREHGGGWGTLTGRTATGAGAGHGTPVAGPPGAPLPRQRQAPPRGPRQDYLDAFDEDDDLFTPRPPASAPTDAPHAAVTDWNAAPVTGIPSDLDDDNAPPTGEPAPARAGKGRAFTGIAAAAVTTVLAVVVAGQVADRSGGTGVQAQSADDQARDVRDAASRGDGRETPSAPSAEPLTYEQKMDKRYPLSAARASTGKFDAVPGIDKAPGVGEKFTYRVDVEQGLGLDGELFAEAVQRTLNDDRSWAHNGARTFERIHSGQVDFVITLAGPETTAEWCAKSGLDTTVDNVSCDSAATERVMINAYRWAQGAETYGDRMHAYRQMLINHEIGHRLGYDHVTCDKNGDLAPVMQQQTKFLEYDGISCRPNPWPFPKS